MDFVDNLVTLSSTGIVEFIFTTLESAGTWAGAAVDLIGLV